MTFDLMYHLGMSLADIDNCDVFDLEWFHSKVAEEKRHEKEDMAKTLGAFIKR